MRPAAPDAKNSASTTSRRARDVTPARFPTRETTARAAVVERVETPAQVRDVLRHALILAHERGEHRAHVQHEHDRKEEADDHQEGRLVADAEPVRRRRPRLQPHAAYERPDA